VKNYEALLRLFSAHLENYLRELSLKQPKELYEPENYILSLGGKRIRPLLALIACDLFDKDPKQALNSALCVELFHNFSLVHDDILDKAPLRRGQPTVHSKWNKEIGILSGDVMLVKAFDALRSYEAGQLKELLSIFVKTSIEVCEGQQMDMNFEASHSVSVEDYTHMITNKTAVLLGCSLKMGAINGGAPQEDADHLYEFGKHLGVAFQLMDDVLDAFGDANFGKQTGGDIIAGKKTFLLLKTFELADKKQKESIDYFLSLDSSRAAEKVRGVLDIYGHFNIRVLAQQEADKYTKEAVRHLHLVKASEQKKKELEAMALNLLNREL